MDLHAGVLQRRHGHREGRGIVDFEPGVGEAGITAVQRDPPRAVVGGEIYGVGSFDPRPHQADHVGGERAEAVDVWDLQA